MEKYVSGDRVCGETFLSCGLFQWGGIDGGGESSFVVLLEDCGGERERERGQGEGKEDGGNDKDEKFCQGEDLLMGRRDRDNDVKEKRRGLYKRRRKRKEKGKWITREVTEIMMNKEQGLLKIKKR